LLNGDQDGLILWQDGLRHGPKKLLRFGVTIDASRAVFYLLDIISLLMQICLKNLQKGEILRWQKLKR
jgi:hypothetical protein